MYQEMSVNSRNRNWYFSGESGKIFASEIPTVGRYDF